MPNNNGVFSFFYFSGIIMNLSASMEDYLEAIYVIDQSRRAVRVKDVAQKLGVTMPSVNGALKSLEARGLIKHEKYDYIELTESGLYKASKILSRHRMIFTFLKDILNVDTKTAQADACKIEHVLSSSTIEKMTDYIDRSLTNTGSDSQS